MHTIHDINFDNDGFIIQSDGDAGDSAQRLGMYHIALWVRSELLGLDNIGYGYSTPHDFTEALDKIEVSAGIYIRHPKQWNDPRDFSRDQQTPLVIAMGLYGLNERLDRLYNAQSKRTLHKYQNKDIPTPEHWGFYARARRENRIYAVGDSFKFINSVLTCQKAKDLDYCDEINHMLSLLQSAIILPTSMSRNAMNYYVRNRPRSLGSKFESNNIMAAIYWYFRPESGGSVGFVDLMRPIIHAFFNET